MKPGVSLAHDLPSKQRTRSSRRVVLLASTIVVLGVAALVVAPALNLSGGYPAAVAQNLTAQAGHVSAPAGFADIVAKVKPAVVSVRVKVKEDTASSENNNFHDLPPGLRQFFHFGIPNLPQGVPHDGEHNIIMGQGSAFFISPDGYAVTNNHVVAKATSVEVQTDDGAIHKAKVIGTDPRTDLALIKVDGGPFPYVKLASKTPRIGDWVLAVGNPFGLGGTVTAGILSARHREINNSLDEYLQIDAPINKGNSGGPTFDTEGNVIGVNTAIYSPSGGSVGIAFAIPADTVRAVISQLKAHGSVTRGWLGVQIQPVTKDLADSLGLKKAEGALVGETIPNSPAAKAGIKASDVVTAVNGKPIKDAHDLANTIGGLAPKTEVKLSIVHNGTEKTVSLALGKMPSQVEANASPKGNNGNGNANLAKLGLTLAPAARVAGAGKKGVVVTDVDSSGVAADRGISTGDIILEVAGKPVATPGEVRKEINQARLNGKRNVLIRLKSGDTTHFVALPVGHG